MPEMNDALMRDAAAYADRWLAFQQRFKDIPALAAAIRLGNNLILSSAYGEANREQGTAVTPNHIFRVASHSKWFTAVAIMQLREKGKLRLDDALAAYIPWLRPPVANLTIRDVLNHAAGITRDGYDIDYWQLERPFPDGTGLRELVETGGAVLPSNSMLKYSNIGFSLLGNVIEAASGTPYNQYMREQIVERLGLESTGPETNADARARMVTGYTSRRTLLPRTPLPDAETAAMSPATGFYSTAEDLTRFAAAQFFGNDELISDESKREMQRPYWTISDMDSYGLGMQVAKIGERWMAGHSGGFPGHTTRTVLHAEDGFAVSVLTSESGGIASELAKSVVKLIDLALAQTPAENPAELDRFTGRFVGLWSYSDVFRLGERLFTVGPDQEDPVAEAFRLEIEDETTLKLEDKEGYGSPGEYIRYERDANGTVVKIRMAGMTEYPDGTADEYLQRRRNELSALAGQTPDLEARTAAR